MSRHFLDWLKLVLRRKESWYLIGFGLVTIIVSAIISYRYFAARRSTSLTDDRRAERSAVADKIDLDSTAAQDLETVSFLLLGYGGAGHDGGYLTDVIQLVRVHFERRRIDIISIPRDLWLELPTGKQAKINAAFTLGEDPNQKIDSGGQVAKQMASIVTGLPVNYFVSVDFVGFKRLIGQELNGVEVDVPQTLDDPWYPIKGEELNLCGLSPGEIEEIHEQYSGFELERQFECRYRHVHFDQGLNRMEGGDALAYVRSRHGSGAGDFSRSQRQHALLKALFKKLLSMQALENAPSVFEELSVHLHSDLDLDVVKYLVPAFKNIGEYQINTVVLSTDNVFINSKSSTGQFIVIPKEGVNSWAGVQEYVNQQLN
jgi:LCP family protein required for cell wall assembly